MSDTDAPEREASKPEFPMDAKPWLDLLKQAEQRDLPYQGRCDRIDEQYSGPHAGVDINRDRELALFWANMQVLNPAVFSRPPVPEVAPRFRDRKQLPRTAGQIMERALVADQEMDDTFDVLCQARDDLNRLARGVVWLRLVEDDLGLRVACEHVCRQDFRTGSARKWAEVPWVGKRAFLTREEYTDRFPGTSLEGVEFKRRLSEGDNESKETEDQKAAVWEIWHRAKRKVVWVAEGAKALADARDPMYSLERFWPCPRPAYGTLKPGTLCPVPDVTYYQGQLDEINELTDRIAKLCDALKVRGFFAAGNGDIGSAIELALSDLDNGRVMIPVPNFAAVGGVKLADAITWMPIEQVAATLKECVEQRIVLMQNVYEISGLSDIMRGETDAQETLGAQQLKAQNAGRRVAAKRDEMQRLARDVLRIKAEIMAEHFPIERLLEMSQTDDVPTQADLDQQAQQIQAQCQQQIMALMQQAMQGQPVVP